MKIVIALLLLFSTACFTYAADDCLDLAVGIPLVNSALQYQLTEPTTNAQILALLQILSNILQANPSPYAINIGVGYADDKYFSVQSCNVLSAPCFSITSGYVARSVLPSNRNIPYLYEIVNNNVSSINLSNPSFMEKAYYPTQRPWYDSNGWSPIYPYANLPVNGRTYEQTQTSTSAHVMSDRISYEPCSQCLTNSPAINAATYLTNSATQLASWSNLNSQSDVQNALVSLVRNFLIPSQRNKSISSIGPGFSNGDWYFVTDCNAYVVASSTPECGSAGYVGNVLNTRLYGSTLRYFAINESGSISGPRDTGTTFNTTSRPWYNLMQGWTDPYTYNTGGAGTVSARSYASRFNGGVVDVDPNPTNLCPTVSPCNCPTVTCPSTPSCNSGSSLTSYLTTVLMWVQSSSSLS